MDIVINCLLNYCLHTQRLLHLPTLIRGGSFYSKEQPIQRPTTRKSAKNKRLSMVNYITPSPPQGPGIILEEGNRKIIRARASGCLQETVSARHDSPYELTAAVTGCTRSAKDQPASIPAQRGEGLMKCHP